MENIHLRARNWSVLHYFIESSRFHFKLTISLFPCHELLTLQKLLATKQFLLWRRRVCLGQVEETRLGLGANEVHQDRRLIYPFLVLSTKNVVKDITIIMTAKSYSVFGNSLPNSCVLIECEGSIVTIIVTSINFTSTLHFELHLLHVTVTIIN